MSTAIDQQKEEKSNVPNKSITRPSYNDTIFGGNSTIVDDKKTVFRFKVVLLGNVAVGKTSILNRYVDNKYSKDYHCNVGVEFKVKSVSVNQSTIADLKIWDTCGDEKYRAITKQYYRDAQGIILVYDLTQRETYEKLNDWLKMIKETVTENPVIILVGNKLDTGDQRKVTTAEGQIMANRYELEYLEVSAKTGSNVFLIFEELASELVTREVQKDKDEMDNHLRSKLVNMDVGEGTKKGCC